ncbi:vesicle-associated membrane protein 8-like [Nerophis ophidion]|uniref:vesicle-associated membrane protein 8-like n=1 Tax=Nerophis ophidion TaxID=159077 RepID=UPI002ADF02D5|nr:vesicle-associated membrane protein 8-like [Nerophis ophidion]
MDIMDQMNGEVQEVKQIMTTNMDIMLDRGEKLGILVDKSADLKAGAQAFEHTSTKVARSYWWKNVKLVVVIVVIVLIIVLIIILLATGVIPVSAPLPPIVSPTSGP